MEKICGIYKIVSPTNRIYIGQSINILERFRSYKNSECKNQHKLKNSFLKHGIQKHSFEILERCNRDQLNEKEKYYISLFQSFNSKNGLNICSGGNTVMSMRTHTNATKEKIRIKKIGRKHSAETKQKMSVSRKKWKHSDKSKKKMSEIALGKNTWSKGRKMSREFKQKIKDSWVIRKQLKK